MITGSTPQDDQAPAAAGTRERVNVARPPKASLSSTPGYSARTHDTTLAKGLSRNDMIRADYGVNNTLTQALRSDKNTLLPSSSVLHQRQFTSDNTQASTIIAPHAQISSKLNMKRLTTDYVSTRGVTQQHFEHAMGPTFTVWPTDEPEPGSSNIQVQWSCSINLDWEHLTKEPDVDEEGSLRVQSIARNASDPFKPVKAKGGNGTVLYKIRQAFMSELGAQMSSSKPTKIPTSVISYERSVNRVMGYQGSITSKAGSRGRHTKLTVPLQVEPVSPFLSGFYSVTGNIPRPRPKGFGIGVSERYGVFRKTLEDHNNQDQYQSDEGSLSMIRTVLVDSRSISTYLMVDGQWIIRGELKYDTVYGRREGGGMKAKRKITLKNFKVDGEQHTDGNAKFWNKWNSETGNSSRKSKGRIQNFDQYKDIYSVNFPATATLANNSRSTNRPVISLPDDARQVSVLGWDSLVNELAHLARELRSKKEISGGEKDDRIDLKARDRTHANTVILLKEWVLEKRKNN
ncbi:hypothetical protein V866_002423 [Kwoniella sp. B9012]